MRLIAIELRADCGGFPLPLIAQVLADLQSTTEKRIKSLLEEQKHQCSVLNVYLKDSAARLQSRSGGVAFADKAAVPPGLSRGASQLSASKCPPGLMREKSYGNQLRAEMHFDVVQQLNTQPLGNEKTEENLTLALQRVNKLEAFLDDSLSNWRELAADRLHGLQNAPTAVEAPTLDAAAAAGAVANANQDAGMQELANNEELMRVSREREALHLKIRMVSMEMDDLEEAKKKLKDIDNRREEQRHLNLESANYNPSAADEMDKNASALSQSIAPLASALHQLQNAEETRKTLRLRMAEGGAEQKAQQGKLDDTAQRLAKRKAEREKLEGQIYSIRDGGGGAGCFCGFGLAKRKASVELPEQQVVAASKDIAKLEAEHESAQRALNKSTEQLKHVQEDLDRNEGVISTSNDMLQNVARLSAEAANLRQWGFKIGDDPENGRDKDCRSEVETMLVRVQFLQSEAYLLRKAEKDRKLRISAIDTEVEVMNDDIGKLEHEMQQRKAEHASLDEQLAEAKASLQNMPTPFPKYWHVEKAKLAQSGLALHSIQPEDPAWPALQQMLVPFNEKDFGYGRDQKEKGRYKGLHLKAAWRIENVTLWYRFLSQRAKIGSEIGSIREVGYTFPPLSLETARSAYKHLPDAPEANDVNNEVFLMHGTNPDIIGTILRQGLNERFCNGLFGHGSYLAEDCSKNDQYVRQDASLCTDDKNPNVKNLHRMLYSDLNVSHPGNCYYIVVCRALLGCPIRTKDGTTDLDDGGNRTISSSGKAPNDIKELTYVPGLPNIYHHSLIVEKGVRVARHREFLLYHSESVYPEYLVAYHRA